MKWLAKDNCCNEGTPLRAHSTICYESRAQHLYVSDQRNRQLTGIHTPLVRDDSQLVAISLVSDRKLSAFDQPPNHPYGCIFNVGTETHEREHAAHLYERQRQEHHSIKLS